MRILHMVTVLLPKAHRDTLEILFVFLKWVASFSHIDEETGSKMDLTNLATVLAPNILYSKGPNPAKDETFLANRAVLSILENQESFWTVSTHFRCASRIAPNLFVWQFQVPAELEAVLQDRDFIHQSADMTSRDILKRCEKHALHQKQSANRLRSDYHPGLGPAGPNGKPMMRTQHQQGPASMAMPQQQQHLPPQPSQAQPQQGPYGNPEAPQYASIATKN
jgi:RhoGAP domain